MPSGLVMPCQKIITLVKSTKASKPLQIAGGFKLVTRDVEDALVTDPSELGLDHLNPLVLSSMCTLDNLPAYRLDPPRGGSVHALVTVTGQVDDVFVAKHVQILTTEQATAAKSSLLKLLQVAAEINSKDNHKRIATWNEDESPAKARKCRALGKCPTGDAVKDTFP